jgi:hypothetical protein
VQIGVKALVFKPAPPFLHRDGAEAMASYSHYSPAIILGLSEIREWHKLIGNVDKDMFTLI